MPTEISDSENDKPTASQGDDNDFECTSPHAGRVILNEIYSIHIDQLFTLLFTFSKFYLDFHASRKSSDLAQTPWTHNPLDKSKTRVVTLTMFLGQTMGPKTCHVTETQTMLPCSKSGIFYAVDVETVNARIPYADAFYVTAHYCLRKFSDTQTLIQVTTQLKFKKNVWGLVKVMIERNVVSGSEDFFNNLHEALQTEGQDSIPELRRKSRRKRRLQNLRKYSLEDGKLNTTRKESRCGEILTTALLFVFLVLLLVINVMLYHKLWSLEEPTSAFFDLNSLKYSPKSRDDWIKLLKEQENVHSDEIQKWQSMLKSAVHHLTKAEASLDELQGSINLNYMSQVVSSMQDKHKGNSEL